METARGADDEGTRVELFVRSLSGGPVHDLQEEVVERLSALAATGRVDGFDLHVWGSELPHESAAARSEHGRFVADRVATFRRWGRDSDRALPGLAAVDRDSALTGEGYAATSLPRLALAEFEDGHLRHVAPCEGPECHTTVADRVAALEAGRTTGGDLPTVPVASGVATGGRADD